MFIEYNRARYVLRDLIGDEADITVYKEAFVKMKATAVTISPNKLIFKNLKVEETTQPYCNLLTSQSQVVGQVRLGHMSNSPPNRI